MPDSTLPDAAAIADAGEIQNDEVHNLVVDTVTILIKLASSDEEVSLSSFHYVFSHAAKSIQDTDPSLPPNGGASLLALRLAFRVRDLDNFAQSLVKACRSLGVSEQVLALLAAPLSADVSDG